MSITDVAPVGPARTTAIVLAGGKGTRLAELYADRPKPLVPAGGKPFLYWVTAWLAAQGVHDIVYSVGHMADQIEAWAAGVRPKVLMSLACVREVEPLGTGGGVLNALGRADETVLVLNGDSLILTDLAPAFAFLEEGADGAVVATEVADAGRYGSIRRDTRGYMQAFAEKRPGRGLVNAGIYLFRTALLKGFPAGRYLSLERDILPALLGRNARLGVAVAEAPFLDIGLPETAARADAFIAAHAQAFADWC